MRVVTSKAPDNQSPQRNFSAANGKVFFGKGRQATASSELEETPLRVFLADDSRLVMERLMTYLTIIEGVHIIGSARTTRAAIRGIQHLSPDLVILDFQMPDGNGIDVLKAIKQSNGPPLVMMLTNLAYPQYRAQCMQWGADYFFDKSQDFEQVIETCRALSARAVRETIKNVSEQETEPVGKGQKSSASNAPRYALIVEDDDVNRWLAARLLEQKGYVVNTVTNGEAALVAVERDSFDLILMDIQMPLLDGLATTQVIRQRERQTGGRVPIIALTAETDAAKAQRYWRAGMDSYLIKPIRTEEFYRTIEAVLTLHERMTQTADLPRVFDEAAAFHQTGNDVELLQQVTERFFNTAPHLVAAMQRAITKDDPYNLEFAAHRLRETANHLAAYAIAEQAERLELISSIRNLSQAETTLAALEEELARFQATVATMIAQRLQANSKPKG